MISDFHLGLRRIERLLSSFRYGIRIRRSVCSGDDFRACVRNLPGRAAPTPGHPNARGPLALRQTHATDALRVPETRLIGLQASRSLSNSTFLS